MKRSPLEAITSRFSSEEQKKRHMRSVGKNRNNTRRSLGLEPLEKREMLSANPLPVNDIVDFGQAESTAEIGKALYSDTFDNASDASEFWGKAEADIDISDGELALKTNKLYTSEQEFPPSEENPLVVKLDFKVNKDGIKLFTRHDGTMNNGAPNNALMFCVEYNSVGMYLYDQSGGNTRLVDSNGRNSYVTIPNLSDSEFYTLVAEDRGDSASITVYDGDTEIERVEGAITRDAKGNKMDMMKFGGHTQSICVDNIEVTYGTETVEEPVVEVVEEEEVETSKDAYAAAVDAVMAEEGNDEPSNSEADTAPINVLSAKPEVTLFEKLAALDVARSAAETAVTEIQNQIATLETQINTIEGEIAALEKQLEAGGKIPDCALGAGRYSTSINATYHSLPAGIQMQILDSRGSVGASALLPAGDGSQDLGIPNVGTDLNMTVQLVHPELGVLRESITDLSVFRNNAHKGMDSGWIKFTSFSSDFDETELTATRDALIAQLSTLESDRDALVAQLPKAQSALSDAQEELRESIPYSRMLVAGSSNGSIGFRYSTGFDNVTFKLHAGTAVVNIPTTHVGGEQNKTFSHRMPADLIGENCQDKNRIFNLDMLGPDGQVLGRVLVRGDGTVASKQEDWEHLQLGKMAENPIEPRLQIAAIKDNTILFAVASCNDVSRVTMDGRGIMSSVALKHEGGSELSMGQVSFNAEKENGTYSLRLFDHSHELDSIAFVWNGTELSLVDSKDQWTAESVITSYINSGMKNTAQLERSITAAEASLQLTGAQMGLEMSDIVSEEIKHISGSELYMSSSLFVSPEELHKIIYDRFPHWQNGPNWEAYVTKLWEDGGRTSTRGRCEDWAYGDRRDYFAWKTEELHRRENTISELLYKAVNMINQLQHGGHERELWEEFSESYESSKSKMTVSVPGINIPSCGDIFAEARSLYESNTQQLTERVAAQNRANRREVLRLSDPLVGGDGSSIDRSNYLAEDPEVDRRVARAGRLAQQALAMANDARADAVIASRDEENIQRDRYIAQQEALIAMGNEAAIAIAARGDTGNMGPDDVITYVSEEIASIGDWASLIRQDEEIAAKTEVEQTIKDRVNERLNARLTSMTAEERAEAEGLLRLKEEGKLDEYFASMFTGETSATVDAELNDKSNYSVFYLVDNDAVRANGHAAVLMGSESEGWYYFSFGVGTTEGLAKFRTTNGNMDADFFTSIREAQMDLDRYTHYLRWDVVNASAIRTAFQEATEHLTKIYFPIGFNCDDSASDIIRAAGIDLEDNLRPNVTYLNQSQDAAEASSWKEFIIFSN